MLDQIIRLSSWTQKVSYTDLEKALSVSREEWETTLKMKGIENYVILSTCNRLEIYYSIRDADDVLFNIPGEVRLSSEAAIGHLFRVAAGLESMSVGENEILHQVKEAFESAVQVGTVHGSLALIFRRAISTGKLVRKNTAISKGKVSLPALALDVLSKNHGISGKRVTVVGTGKMASDLVNYLRKMAPLKITVVGRNHERAEALSSACDGSWMSVSSLMKAVSESEIIVTATTSREILVKRSDVTILSGKRVFLDVSNPRNVEGPLEGDNYILYDLAALSPVLEQNRASKVREIGSAEIIVRSQVNSIVSRLSKIEIETLIGNIYKHAEELKQHEISRLKKALAAGTDFDRALEAMSSALIKKILASQTSVLREVHGSRVTSDILAAIEGAYLGKSSNISSAKSRDLRENQNRQGQTPRLSRKP